MLRPHKLRPLLCSPLIPFKYIPIIQARCLRMQTRALHTTPAQYAWFSKKKKQNAIVLTVDNITAETSLDDTIVALKTLTRINTISTASKKRKLKAALFQTIEKSPDQSIKSEHLRPINDAIFYIMENTFQGAQTDYFQEDEMISILRASVKNLSLSQVHDLLFIPIFYSTLSKSKQISEDDTKRLGILEIFVKYILLSNKRYQYIRLLESYVGEHPEQTKDVVLLSLDALKNSSPDSKSLLKLAEYYDFSDPKTNDQIIDFFIEATRSELDHGYKDDLVANLSAIVNIVETKSKKPLLLYTRLLSFCSNNDVDTLAKEIISKILKLPDKNVKSDVAESLVMACVKYNTAETIGEQVFTSSKESLAALLWELSRASSNDFQNFAKAHENELNDASDLESYNKLLQICVYAQKPKDFINDFDDFYQEHYGLQKNALSYAILIDDAIKKSEIMEGVEIFESSIENDFIEWGKEEEGRYLSVIFKLFAHYTRIESDFVAINLLYNKIKDFGYRLDEESLSTLFVKLVDNFYVGDSFDLIEKELPKDQKIEPQEYPLIYNRLLEFIKTYSEDYEVNWQCYLKLDKFFMINYEDYYLLMEKFCNLSTPVLAYKVFTSLRNYSKENLIQPPNEKMYKLLFEKFGQLEYETGVSKLHLLLKVDMNINLDIDLLNSVLESFTNVQDLLKARDTFDLIMALPANRGLNSRSVSIMLKCHTFMNAFALRTFWNNLSQIDYFPTKENYRQYLIGYCYHDCHDAALSLVSTWDAHNELPIDEGVLKLMYNWTPSLEGKVKIAEFAETNHNEIWTRLKHSGELIEEEDELPSLIGTAREELLLLK